MGVTDQRDTRVTAMAFQVMGTSPVGTLSTYQLVYFADGLKKQGTVVGTNTGSTWVPGTSPIVSIPFTTPLTLPRNFKGEFALLVDVAGGAGTSFTTQLQTVTMDAGAGDTYVTDTCDLPLAGDTFYISSIIN
jgi:hypothetical protein